MPAKPAKAIAPGAITDLLRELAHAPPRRSTAAPALSVGQTVGRYRVIREIGRGAFGAVYEARDQELPRTVALKVLHPSIVETLGDGAIAREADAAAQLSHPHIVTLHDLGTSDGIAYLVLELLRGTTLVDRLRHGAIPPGEALAIARDVARGLAHAHRRGVVHRDLTPANVFLCDDGVVKILDFGMAHGFGRPKLDGGTRPYMAPEQRRGAPEDERTDVFALGVILYEMLSGELPFPDARALESSVEAAPLDVAGRPAIGELLARMLSKDPVARPRSGEALVDGLAALAAEFARDAPARLEVRVHRRGSLPIWASGAVVVFALAVAWRWHGRHAAAPTAPAVVESAGTQRAPEIPIFPAPSRVEGAKPVPADREPSPVERPRTSGVPKAKRSRELVRECRDSIGGLPTPLAASGEGILTIEADPFGDVFVDGKPEGEAPRECRVTAEMHRVRVVHGKLGAREALVRVGPGERERWLARFEAAP